MTNRLYIGKIGQIPRNELYKTVSQYGTILDFMMKDTYAFVEYANDYEARNALLELDGRSIMGQRILVEPAKPKGMVNKKPYDMSEKYSISDNNYFSAHPRLYVGRLPRNCRKSEIQSLFGKYGDIVDLLVKDDFAFVTITKEYATGRQAQEAMQDLNGYMLNNSRIIVEEARPKESEEESLLSHPRLYVGKLSDSVKKQDLISTFSVYGEIMDVLMKDDFAFIEYSTIHSATRAMLELHGAKIFGSKIIVEEAKPREGETIPKQRFKSMPGQKGGTIEKKNLPLSVSKKKIITRRRKSPRRSLSRSRSRSIEKENKLAAANF